MKDDLVPVFYPGHLGPKPWTPIDAERHITWDRPCKLVPAKAAASLTTLGGFYAAQTVADCAAATGIAVDALHAAITAGDLQTSELVRRDAAPETVIVLDPATRRALCQLTPPPAESPASPAAAPRRRSATTAATP